MAGSLPGSAPARALAAICAFVVVLGAWNVLHYPPGKGYDAPGHIAYADGLVPGGHIPHGINEWYTPPGYYAVAGSADWIAGGLGVGERHRAGSALNILFLLGTVLLVWRIARELWPGRDRLAIGAAAFVAFLPVTVKAEAMFHPETLSLFVSTLAIWLCVKTFADRRYAFALGAALGAAQLVRAFGLWTVVVVAIALAAGRRWRELAIVVTLAAVIAAPWYLHQQHVYGHPIVFNQVASKKPVWDRRPVSFFVGTGLPDVVTAPYRPHFLNRAAPMAYSELWGDYYGAWVWEGVGSPSAGARHRLQIEAIAGVFPTLLAIGGWIALLLASLRSPRRLAVVLLPLFGTLGFLYFAMTYQTPDGDVVKATYMLTTTAGWALGFGYALERLRGRLWLVAAGLAAFCALVELPFLIYG